MAGDISAVPAAGRILFYKRDRAAFGFLSNFHPAPIQLGGEPWRTVEHYYQAQKSPAPDYRQAIREADTPGHAKRLGADPTAPLRVSRQSWFRQTGETPRKGWQEAKLDVMRAAVRAKFLQNPDLGELLLATGTAEFADWHGWPQSTDLE